MKLSKELKNYLIKEGATEVGFADLSDFPDTKYTSGISIFIKLPYEMVIAIPENNPNTYFKHYDTINNKLDEIVMKGEEFLKNKGYDSYAITQERTILSEDKRSKIPHKTVGTKSGIGWIGKCALIVNKKYGSAIRLSTILTEAPLDYGTPITESKCGTCKECMEICPVDAVLGENWNVNKDRKEFFDYKQCMKMIYDFTNKNMNLCGKCIYICPHTQKYLKLD